MRVPMLRSPYFARAKRAPPKAAKKAPPKAARASRAQEKGDHNMGAAMRVHDSLTFESLRFARVAGAARAIKR